MATSSYSDFDDQKFTQFSNPALVHRDLETLAGILSGIIADSIINPLEHSGLIQWIESTKPYENRQPYREVLSLLREAAHDNIFTEDEAKNIIWFCNLYIKKNGYYNELTSGILKLKGIVLGLSIDNKISEDELVYLNNWLIENEQLKTVWPYDELFSLTMKILEDGELSEYEHTELLRFCSALNVDDSEASNKEVLSALSTGFFQIDPKIIIDGRTFCITGVSKKYKRADMAAIIDKQGGIVNTSVSKKVDYLVVCDEKNSCWAYTCYGRKIEEAMLLRKNGVNISIIHEVDLLDLFQKFE